jgi:RHS repeat-associated protein
LSVMPGDTISMEVYAKYLDPNSNNWNTALTNFIGSITGGTAPAGTFVDGGSAGSIGGGTYPISGINHASESGTAPKAYLNYIVFNKDMTTVLDMGFKRITTNSREYGQDAAHDKLAFEGTEEVLIKEPGYVYIYLSNENETSVEVFFDDFKVVHKKSLVVQMDDYYPFGLTYNSYLRENSTKNNHLYNAGSEIQDELDLGVYDTFYRTLDPCTGRWWQIDPMVDELYAFTPYNYVFNNPIRYNDPKGDCPPDQDCSGTVVEQPSTHPVTKIGDAIVSAWNYFTGDAPTPEKVVTGINTVLPVNAVRATTKLGFGALGVDVGQVNNGEAIGAIKEIATTPLFFLGPEAKLATIETSLPKVAAIPQKSIVAANGLKVAGFTTHAVNRSIQRNIKPASILDALKNPLQIKKAITDELGRVSQRFIGGKAEVVVSRTSNKIVSTNPTSTKKAAKLKEKLDGN